jgi:hypothetical protein
MKHTSIGQIPLFALACLIALVTSARAQAKPDEEVRTRNGQEKRDVVVEEQKQEVKRIFEIKYADPYKLMEILRVFTGAIVPSSDLRVIAVNGTREAVAAVEDAIRRLDVPPPPAKNIELIAFLVLAAEQASGKSVPPELESVITQLKSVFKYQGFQLLDTLVVRCRNRGPGSVNGVAAGSTQAMKTLYDFNFQSATITSDNTGKTIRIDRLKLGARLPIMPTNSQLTYIDTGILTDIDVREGQKVVVGKATVDGSNNALFLVVTAKVLD